MKSSNKKYVKYIWNVKDRPEIVNLIVTIIAIAFALTMAIVSISLQDYSGAIAGLLVGIFVILVSHIFYSFIWRDKVSRELNESTSWQRAKQAAEYVGSSVRLFNELREDVVNAREIVNTSVAIEPSFSRDTDRSSCIYNLYAEWLSAGSGVWVDIIGVKEFFQKRYSYIQPDNEYFERKKNSREPSVYAYILKPYLPIINFIILDKDDGSVVYFGWDKFRSGEARVFRSTNINVIQMFRKYSRSLISYSYSDRGDPYEVAFNGGHSGGKVIRSGFIDKEGIWINISYENLDEKDRSKINILSVGRINISFKNNEPFVLAQVYRKDGHENEELEHDSKHIYLFSKNAILIKYDTVRTNEGYCLYEFKKVTDEKNARDGVNETMRGFYADGRINGTANIIGFRTDDRDLIEGNVYSDEYFEKVAQLVNDMDLLRL